MNYELLFKTAMLAGEIMANSGAETFRVEDTIYRILQTSNLQFIDIFATTTGIMASFADKSTETITGVKRIIVRSNNLSRINDVNQISRNICDGNIDIEEAYEQLLIIKNTTIYSRRTVSIATVISSAGFVGVFGGNFIDFLIAMVNGLSNVIINRYFEKRIMNTFALNAVKSFIIALLTMISTLLIPNAHQEIIIIGSIMPLVPGLPITNAIRDTLQGDYMSGTARAVEAFVTSFSIAVGVGAGIGFYNLLGGMLHL